MKVYLAAYWFTITTPGSQL